MFSNSTFTWSVTQPAAHGARYGHELNTTVPVPSQGTRIEDGMDFGVE